MRVSTRTKLFLSHFLAIVLVSGSIGSYFYTSAIDNMMRSLQSRLLNSAALLGQDFSAARLNRITRPADQDGELYQQLSRRIRAYASTNADIAFVYVMRKLGDKVVFVLDSDVQPALPGEVYEEYIPELLQGFEHPSVDKAITSDKWGHFLSGYAPIHDGVGDYLIGIDMRADEVNHKLFRLQQAGLLSLSVSIILAAIFAHWLSRSFNFRIDKLVIRCSEIARTQLESSINRSEGDELDKLGETIESMARHLDTSRDQNEHARRDLEAAKQELETRVQQRTRDLEKMNHQLRDEIKERKRMEKELEKSARTDFLTHLLNRRAMMQILDNEAARFERSGHPFSLVLLDVDNFKDVNDTLGHDGGDEILVAIADFMQAWIREQDVLSRWGGEEFLILLSDTDLDNAAEQADRLRTRLMESTFEIQNKSTRVTASLGVAQYRKAGGVGACIKEADIALYQAKKAGRNCVITSDTHYGSNPANPLRLN